MAAKKSVRKSVKKSDSGKNKERTVPVYNEWGSRKYHQREKVSELREYGSKDYPKQDIKKGYILSAQKMSRPGGVDTVVSTAPKSVKTRKGTTSGKAKKK